MTMSSEAVDHYAVNFDYHDPKLTDPHPVYAKLRASRPVAHSPVYGGHWVISGYEQAHAAFMDASTFSSSIVSVPVDYGQRPLIPEQLDEPEHKMYRRLLQPAFTAQSAALLEPLVRERCRELIAAFPADAEIDFIERFATPFPVSLFMGLLGLPGELMSDFVRYRNRIIHGFHDDPDGLKRATAAEAVYAEFGHLIRARRRCPGDDLVSFITSARLGGEPLNMPELLDICFTMFVAGLDTTSAALGQFFLYLAQDMAAQQEIRENPNLIPSAIEELLRYESPITTARLATRDIDFYGCPIRKGDGVLILTGAANRDEQQFRQADEVFLKRHPNRHLGFGLGIHRCLGIHLARLQLRVALEEFHRSFSSFTVPKLEQVRRRGSPIRGVDYLPLSLVRAASSS